MKGEAANNLALVVRVDGGKVAGCTDDLQVELQDFVNQIKLKMTGGAQDPEGDDAQSYV